MYGDDYKPMDDHIPIPISLKGIKDWECFVKTFMIPASEKKHILSELDLLGINESVLFPDLDHDAIYVKSKWVSKSET